MLKEVRHISKCKTEAIFCFLPWLPDLAQIVRVSDKWQIRGWWAWPLASGGISEADSAHVN